MVGRRGNGRCTLGSGACGNNSGCNGTKPGGGAIGTLGSGKGFNCGSCTLGSVAVLDNDAGCVAALFSNVAICTYAFFV